jgi:diguanylate cyclase (GGDEF)-like protein
VGDTTSNDRSVDSRNGATDAQQESIAADERQRLDDRAQMLSETDQTGSDTDQTAADSDQAAADSDQEASDRDLEQGGDPYEHDLTRDLRDRSAVRRRHTAQARLDAAAARDAIAQERDRAALARDQAAARHDRELAARDAAWATDGRDVPGEEMLLRAAENRRRAAADRAAAAEGRARAAADRLQATHDREQAARDRLQAQADRDVLLHHLAAAETDALTGARTRGPGLTDLNHEIDRVRRTRGELAIAYVDVVGLKSVNDAHGHAFGDALLQRAVRGIRSHLRSYDLIVRVGGDEFLCVMSGATIQEARQRFDDVRATLTDGPDHCEIRVGFAVLEPTDTAAELIQRADTELQTGRVR